MRGRTLARHLFVAAAWMTMPLPDAAASVQEDFNTDPTPSAGIREGVPEVIVAYDFEGKEIVSGRPGGRGRWRCEYYLMGGTIITPAPGTPQYVLGPIRPQDGDFVFLTCMENNRPAHDEIFVWTPDAPFGQIDSVVRAAGMARDQLDIPVPEPATSPPSGAMHITGIPTWFWTTTAWQPISASASLAGVTATATATPVKLVVDPGDDTSAFECQSGGTAYDPELSPPAQRSDCTHTFKWRSRRHPSGRWPATLTITWQISWTASNGESGTFEDLTTTTTIPIHVGDAQALLR